MELQSQVAKCTYNHLHFFFFFFSFPMQVYHDSDEGRRFMQFYKVVDFPHVAVLDPRTGNSFFFFPYNFQFDCNSDYLVSYSFNFMTLC